MKTIELSCFDIVVQVDEKNPGGCISSSSLKKACPACNQVDCYFDCDIWEHHFYCGLQSSDPKSDLPESTETEEDVASRRDYNAAIDGIEALILAHGCAGVNITSPAYLEAIETAVDAVANNC